MDTSTKIAILGYGIEGRAVTKYLLRHGFKSLTIYDERVEIKELPEGVKTQLGEKAFLNLLGQEVIFRSPGIALLRPELRSVKEAGAEFTSQTEYFFENCPCQIIGISGTKGKGTTTVLTSEILKKGAKRVFVGGNLGNPPIDFLDELTPDDIVVLELSSFQLEDLSLSPHLAIVLNVSSDHLDYHSSVTEYKRAKEALVKHQKENDIAIINMDYEGSRAFSTLGAGKKYGYSKGPHGESTLQDAHFEGENIVIFGEVVAQKKDIALRGEHNYENALPACLVGKLFGIENEDIITALREFIGLPHRLEFVCEKNGVKYFNDSFSTTPETSIAGVRAFTEPLILIAGGSEKFSDFTLWARACALATNLKTILLIGLTADRMEEALQGAIAENDNPKPTPLQIIRAKSLEDAFLMLKTQALPGDIVLLSPACASFDQFENYKKRGEAFRKLAKEGQAKVHPSKSLHKMPVC